MKLLLSLSLLVSILFPSKIDYEQEVKDLNIRSENYLLYSLDLDEVILEQNANKEIQIASIQKVLTSMTAIDILGEQGLDKLVTVKPEILENIYFDASIAYLRPYQELTIKEVLYGVMLSSGADATSVLADEIAGSEEAYAELMNDFAKKIGMTNTVAKNASGLDEDGQHSTLYDVLTLLKYSLQNEVFLDLYTKIHYDYTDIQNHRVTDNSLKYLVEDIKNPYIYGAKSGFTDLALRSLSSVAKDDYSNYILITTRGNTNANSNGTNQAHLDAIDIYDYYFTNFKPFTIATDAPNKIRLKRKLFKYKLDYPEELRFNIHNDIKQEDLVHEYEFKEDLKVPLEEGTIIGSHKIIHQEDVIKELDIILNKDIKKDYLYYIVIFLVTLIISFVLFVILYRRRVRRLRRRRRLAYERRFR